MAGIHAKILAVNIVRFGPDGLLFPEMAVISAVVAIVTWRQVGFRAAARATIGLAILIVGSNAVVFPSPNVVRQLLVASFVIVPSAILLGASRLRWLAARPWTLLLLGPLAFEGSYLALCACAVSLAPKYFL